MYLFKLKCFDISITFCWNVTTWSSEFIC